MHRRGRGALSSSVIRGVVGPTPQVVALLKTAPALTPQSTHSQDGRGRGREPGLQVPTPRRDRWGSQSPVAASSHMCESVCVLCEASFIWSEPVLGTPASAGRPYACASAIGGEGAEGRKAEGRKPKAAGSTGPLIKMRCR